MKFVSYSEESTKKIARKILRTYYPAHKFFLLYGDFGAGKTIFVKGMAEYLSLSEDMVKSPSFTYVREYDLKNMNKFIHMDLYRLNCTDDIVSLGLYSYLAMENSLMVIEWAEKWNIKQDGAISIYLRILGENSREIEVIQNSKIKNQNEN